jgi:alpha-ketoglutarate-dependent taurine dioxygenase
MHTESPFSLETDAAYRIWRDQKLADYPVHGEQLIVEIADPKSPSLAEITALQHRIDKTNMAIFACRRPFSDRETLREFAARFGLRRLDNHLCTDEDGISALQVSDQGHKKHYIPYTNHKINWHTDGYYNPLDHQIHGMALYCVQQAAEGGGNRLLDHEIAYIRLREENPDFIRALSAPDAMTIPPNDVEGEVLREATVGPVFSVQPSGALHMRYTARQRNIIWREDPTTQAALAFLLRLFSDTTPPIFSLKLEAGQGVLCNNVLHYRDGFQDDPRQGQTRLYYRARYYDRIASRQGSH